MMKTLRILVRSCPILVLVAIVWGMSIPSAKPPVSPRLADAHQIPSAVLPILDRACLDCHSDQTRWPWYNRLPGVAMLLRRDIRKAREHVNFSRWAGNSSRHATANEIQDICDAVSDGSMPPVAYQIMHPDARLSASDRDLLCDWANPAGNSQSMKTTQPAEKAKPTS
jgi:hypothetical protein